MTPQEQTMWEEWAKAATAPDPQQAVKDWAARYKIRLTNQTVMNVTRRVTDGQLSAPSLKITSIALQRTMVDGVLVPPLEEVEGEPVVEAGKKCQDHCASNFEFDNSVTSPGGTIKVSTYCSFAKCQTKVIQGVTTYICKYDCTSTATVKS